MAFSSGEARGDDYEKAENSTPRWLPLFAMSFAASANATASKQQVSAEVKASCQAQAAKKFSAVHFLEAAQLHEQLHGPACSHGEAKAVCCSEACPGHNRSQTNAVDHWSIGQVGRLENPA